MLGLTACAWLAAEGRVAIACDRDERRLEQAKRFGAAHTALPRDLPELVRAVTATRGADAAFELSGSADSAALSLEVLRIGGTAVWVGSVFPTPAVPVLPEMVVRRCLTVTGVHNYAPADLMAAVTFLAENHTQFPFAELVSRTFPLESVPAAFQFAETERPVRVAIRCNAGET
jgi:alcohol dehydrogenase